MLEGGGQVSGAKFRKERINGFPVRLDGGAVPDEMFHSVSGMSTVRTRVGV